MRPGPPPAPAAAPSLSPAQRSHRSSSILPQELQGNFSSRSRGLSPGEPAERRVREGQAPGGRGVRRGGVRGSKRPAHLSDLPAEALEATTYLSSTLPSLPLSLRLLRRFSPPLPFYPLAGAGEQRGRFCGRAASPGLWVYVNIPTDKQATSLISSFPLEKPRLLACCLENAKAPGAVVQVKPVSLGFAGTPLLSVLQCFRVEEILDIQS